MIKMSDPTINEKSHFKISLPMALQALGLIGVLVFGYRDLESRIRMLEHNVEMNVSSVKELVKVQDLPIPSDIRQDKTIEFLQAQLNNNSDDLEYLKRKMCAND